MKMALWPQVEQIFILSVGEMFLHPLLTSLSLLPFYTGNTVVYPLAGPRLSVCSPHSAKIARIGFVSSPFVVHNQWATSKAT
jgi:hypothetical protein